MAQKTEIPGFYKEREGVVINKDNDALKAYKKKKMANRRLDKLESDLSSLKSDINEIKNLLQGLVK